jgi:hypothetical protein
VSKRLLPLAFVFICVLAVTAWSVASVGAQTATTGSAVAGTTNPAGGTTGTGVTGTTAPRATVAATGVGGAAGSPVATGVGGGNVSTTLPATGQQQGGSPMLSILVISVLGLAGLSAGFFLRRRALRA